VQPLLGVRMRLVSIGAGKWQNTGGDKAKFGLMPRQVLELSSALKEAGFGDALKLLHFHMGSQISNVRDIANGMREAVRYFVELSKLGHQITHVDVGGGLGVDYEGTRSRSFCSINYGLDQYAQSIVAPLAEACAEHGMPRAARAHRIRPRDDRAPRGAGDRRQRGRAHAGGQPGRRRASAFERDAPSARDVRRRSTGARCWRSIRKRSTTSRRARPCTRTAKSSLAERAALDALYYAIAHRVRWRC
jgi:arginine decarboxylase